MPAFKIGSNHVLLEECRHFFKGDYLHFIIEVGMNGIWNDHQLLVVPFQHCISIFAEIGEPPGRDAADFIEGSIALRIRPDPSKPL